MNILQKKIRSIFLERVEVYDEDHIFSIINTSLPKIHIEVPKGTPKLGWSKKPLPFHYGELPEYINPADSMGWDVIIAPDSEWNQPGLKVAGIVRYRPGVNKKGNDKIIMAFNFNTTDRDKKVIKDYFKDKSEYFYEPEFFDVKSETPLDENSSTGGGWEDETFKQYKLTRVRDPDYVGMGVGEVARKHFYGTYDKKEPKRK